MSAETRTIPDTNVCAFVETWTCDRCDGRGEVTFDASTTHLDYRAALIADHHEQSPSCRSRVVRSKLYDPDRQVVLGGPHISRTTSGHST